MSMYSVVQYVKQKDPDTEVVTESTSVVRETEDLKAAFVKLNEIKADFWNDANIYRATAKVLDDHLNEYKEPEEITHPEPQPEPPEPEEITEG